MCFDRSESVEDEGKKKKKEKERGEEDEADKDRKETTQGKDGTQREPEHVQTEKKREKET